MLLLLLPAARLSAANPGDNAAFNAAERAFSTTVWDRAEELFADFVKNFPDSPRIPEAILFQAQARYQQSNYAGALQLLSAQQGVAGKLADQYLYWQAQALFRKGDFRPAADAFAKLLQDFPTSTVRLDSAMGQAYALAQLGQWPAVIELLKKPDGVFQTAARTNAANELVPRGFLLLGEAQAAQKDYTGAEATLKPLGTLLLNPKLMWEWQYLMCRILLAAGRAEEALQSSANLMSLATNAAQSGMFAQSVAFKAGLLETLGRIDQAIETYKENLNAGLPQDRQRDALVKITQLSYAQNKLEGAAQSLEKFAIPMPL
jgi:tetratricopeptide (TPR) repeat protein